MKRSYKLRMHQRVNAKGAITQFNERMQNPKQDKQIAKNLRKLF